MNWKKQCLAFTVAAFSAALSAENIKIGERTFLNFSIQGCTADGVLVEHASGLCSVPPELWPPEHQEEIAAYLPKIQELRKKRQEEKERTEKQSEMTMTGEMLAAHLFRDKPEKLQPGKEPSAEAKTEPEKKEQTAPQIIIQTLPYPPRIRNYYYRGRIDPWYPPRPRPPRPCPPPHPLPR